MTVILIEEKVCMSYLQLSALFHFEQTFLCFIPAIEVINFQSKGGPAVWMLFKALADQDFFPSHATKFLCNPLLSQHKTVQITVYMAILLWLPVLKWLLSKITSRTQDSLSLFANAQHEAFPHGPVIITNALETIWFLGSISVDTK